MFIPFPPLAVDASPRLLFRWLNVKITYTWQRGPYRFAKNDILYISIPFSWNLPAIRAEILQGSFLWKNYVVGGPAVQLIPDYFDGMDNVIVGKIYPGILQRVNPLATRTTIGCPRACPFCAVKTLYPQYQELDDWPDLPILCDDNLLACSQQHFDRVINRLIRHGWCDFNQGLDARLLTEYHAQRIAQIKNPIVRLSLDNTQQYKAWEAAYNRLRAAGISKNKIRSYALIGFNSGPEEAWERCQWIEDHGVLPLPMWYHSLDTARFNHVSDEQQRLGWNDYERKKIMQYFYKHRLPGPRRKTIYIG